MYLVLDVQVGTFSIAWHENSSYTASTGIGTYTTDWPYGYTGSWPNAQRNSPNFSYSIIVPELNQSYAVPLYVIDPVTQLPVVPFVGWSYGLVYDQTDVISSFSDGSSTQRTSYNQTFAAPTITYRFVEDDAVQTLGLQSGYTVEGPFVGQGFQTINYPPGTTPASDSFSYELIGATVLSSYSIAVALPNLPALFTTSADTVNFNSLFSAQLSAIAGGATLYNGLGGNDVVTLPNVVNANQSVADGKTLGWNFGLTFNAGPGNDRITGADGDDKIDGGDGDDNIDGGIGDDTIYASPGNDVVKGGNGLDTFDYQFRSFTGYASGTTHRLDGGANLEHRSDLILLPGSADDYSFDVSFGLSWPETTTTIKPTLQSLYPAVSLVTSDLERIDFDNPVENVIRRVGLDSLIELGTQIAATYGESTAAAQTRNWHPVAAIELGMKPSNFQTVASPTGRYTFLDGVYEHLTGINDAVATVLSGVMDGKRTLSISIKGSDDPRNDPADWAFDIGLAGGVKNYYDVHFAALETAITQYLTENISDYDSVTITGHSLGGAASQHLIAKLSLIAGDKLKGFTFGSIGAESAYTSTAAPYLMNFLHTGDIARYVPAELNALLNEPTNRAGSTILINSSTYSAPLPEHSVDGYLADLQLLSAAANRPLNQFYNTSIAGALRTGEIWNGDQQFIQIAPGTDGSDLIESEAADDFVLAGSGNDTISINLANLISTTPRIIDGEIGIDTLRFESALEVSQLFSNAKVHYFVTFADTLLGIPIVRNEHFTVTTVGSAFTIECVLPDDSTEQVAVCYDIEKLQFGSKVFDTFIITGKVSKGYISGAAVFSDENGNGQLDPTEASTTTDANGIFKITSGAGPLIAIGGVDTSTGLQFKGQLSAPSGSSVITPLTTLLALLSSDALAEQKVLSSFGLSSSIDLNSFDPIAAAQAGSTDGVATTAAVAKAYDTVSLIASTLVAAGGEFSSGVKEAFAAIAAAIGGSGIDLTSETDVAALIGAAAQSDGIVLGQDVADSVASIIVASNILLDQQAQSGATGDELLNAIAAIERVIQGTASNAIQQAGNDTDQLQALVDAFSGENLDDAVSTALEHLGVADTTAPTLTPVADQTNEATSAAGATAFFIATASDNVDGTIPVVFKEGNTVVHSGDVFGLGSHTITANAIDAAGNQTFENFKFNVVDTTAPTLTPVPDQTLEAANAAGAAAFFTATATDAVDGADMVVFKEGNNVIQSGDIFGLGNHSITASTIDATGNLSSETFTINVKDTTAPTLTPIADQTLQATTNAGATAFFAATATDLVDGTDPVVFKEGNTVIHSGDVFGLGIHTIVASSVDAVGNSASETFKLNVIGATSHNHDPIALDDSNGVTKGKSLSISASKGVLANDSDSDHDYLSVAAVNGSGANVGHSIKGEFGTLTMNADGSYSYVATAKVLPSQIFAQDTFTYTTVDGHGGSDTSTLTFSVFDASFTYKAGSNTILSGGNGKNVLDGSAGHALAYGGKGADVLIGGNGDILAGGKGPDQFVFRPDFRANTILDFDVRNDHLQFDNSVFESVKSIIDHTTNTPLGALISDGDGDSVLLLGVNKSQLLAHSSDLLIA